MARNEFLARTHVACASGSCRMISASYLQSLYTPTCFTGESFSNLLENQLILCTGGNNGIGYETVKGLVSHGAHVILAARNQWKNLKCVEKITESLPSDCHGNVSCVSLDLSDFNSIVHAVNDIQSRFPGRVIDQLIQNAGVWPTSYSVSAQGHEICYATNVLGPHLLFQLLHNSQMLSKACRLILVTGDIYITVKDCTSDFKYSGLIGCQEAYSRSKLGLMWMASQYHYWYPDYQVYLVHPGVVATDLFVSSFSIVSYFKNIFFITSQQGAQVTLICSTSPLDHLVNGGYYHNTCGRMILPLDDPAMNFLRAQEFYKMTEEYIQPFLQIPNVDR